MKWIDSYKSKLCTAEKAVYTIQSNQRVYVHPGCATPDVLLNAMCNLEKHLENVEVYLLIHPLKCQEDSGTTHCL